MKEMARGAWGNVGRTIAEYVFLDFLIDIDIEDLSAGRIEIEGIETFLKLRDSKKPVIVFTGHTGNWEILPVAARRIRSTHHGAVPSAQQ